MEKNTLRLFWAVCLCVVTMALSAQSTAQVDQPQSYAMASDYSDCSRSPRFSLPLDIDVTESYWLKGYVQDLTQGVSAYLYADTDFKFEVFVDCFFMVSVYSTTFKKNKTSTINAARIQEKLEENGIDGYTRAIYIRISPVDGKGGRLVMRPDSEMMYSDCNDPLFLAPAMSLRSYRTHDVYALDPRDFSQDEDLFVRWYTKDSVSCQAKMTLGACDGQVLEEKTLLLTKDVFRITPEILSQAAQNNQLLYFHFDHDVDSTSYVQCLASKFTEKVYTKTACQGKGVTIGDTTFYESTYYFRDTAYMSTNTFYIRYYDIIITEPEPQYDTLALRPKQFPYTYRGQSVPDYGDYDFTISKAKKCDERYLLHVCRKIDTVVHVTDTTLCYGASFEYEGKIYLQDVSFGKAIWKNQDTLVLDTLNVRFATTPEIIFDTIAQDTQKYGKTFKQTGDFRFTYTNPATFCVDSIILHVKAGEIKYDYYYVDTTLCQGKVYQDYYGNQYTSSVVLYDTTWRVMNKHCEIEIITVTFTEPEIQQDTLYLKTTQLPYKYASYCMVDTFGVFDCTTHIEGACDERYQLLVLHDIDTLYRSVDTTLCQGKIYTYNGGVYTHDANFNDTIKLDEDTYEIRTITVGFTAPETVLDTLSLKSTDLPYTYRGQYAVTGFGNHDVMITGEDVCDEHYLLYVEHDIDTLYVGVDTTLCQGKIYTYNGGVYTHDASFNDTLKLDEDTYEIRSITVGFTAPETALDTLSLKSTDLPYTYRGQYAVTGFGNHDVMITGDDVCDEHYLLYVEHDIDTLYAVADTLLCYGAVYEFQEQQYLADTTIAIESWVNEDTLQINSINIYFASIPEQVYDTLLLTADELPYIYREQQIPAFGDYEFLLYNDDGCQEQVYLSVVENKNTTNLDDIPLYDRPQLIMYDGVVYVLRGTEIYTILGEKLQVTLNDFIAKRHSYSGGALFWYAFC